MPSNIPVSRPRSRTPPEVKWLINERAALRGEALRLRCAIHEHQSSVESLRRRALELEAGFVAPLSRSLASLDTKIEALTASLNLVESDANPDAVGPVRAWAGRYGKRGALIAFLRDAVLRSGPAGITVSSLYVAATCEFDLACVSRQEQRAFRKTIRNRLADLMVRDGLIEVLSTGGGATSTVWRAKPLPTLSDLQRLAESSAAEDADEQRTNADAL